MGKKKHKQRGQQAGWGQADYGGGYGAAHGMANGQGLGMAGGMGLGADVYAAAPDMAAMNGLGAAPGMNNGFLHGLQGIVGSRQTEQFILGALLGAAAVYVLGDEEMRAKLVKTAMKLYSGVAGGFEELKEQMADLKAEVAAEKRSEE
jgi:hypothetical protein